MLEEDLDDTHLCIKCSATIVGLDNYVQHRKTTCGGKTQTTIDAGYEGFDYPVSTSYPKTEVDVGSEKNTKTLSDPYDLPDELGADVFFSSLQLQSVQANTGGKTNSTQQVLTRKATAILLSSGREGSDGVWQEQTPTNTDNLMKAVRDISSEGKKFEPVFKPISFAHGSPEPDQSDDEDEEEVDFEDDDEDDDDYIPTPYSGGKWKPGTQPGIRSGSKWKGRSQPLPHGGKWIPPNDDVKWKTNEKIAPEPSATKLKLMEVLSLTEAPTTGGKWKPGFGKFSSSTKWKATDNQCSPEVIEPQTGGKWKIGDENSLKLVISSPVDNKWKSDDCQNSGETPESPSTGKKKPETVPTTGGKWKPTDTPTELKTLAAWDDSEQWTEKNNTHPPVGHTKGKWIPGSKVEKREHKEEILVPVRDFWCNICCRKLKTKIIYEKHLKSAAHLKKSETEQLLERAEVEQMELSQQVIEPPTTTQREQPTYPTGKRKRQKVFLKCEICNYRMHRHLVGKHLISHYHYVRMKLNGARSFGVILDNIHQIVLHAPFQCTPCRFYTNTEENFLSHWNSMEHRDRTEGPGKFWCSFCRFECEDNNQMRRHLLSSEHREVILAINRSVPIYISKKVIIECPKCHQTFHYNIQLRRHAAHCEGSKVEPIGTASDEYQSRYRCALCPDAVLKSKVALQRHEKFKHNKLRFHCSVCNLEFNSADSAVKHRKTKEHRTKSTQLTTETKKDVQPKTRYEFGDDLRCVECNHISSSEVEAMLHQIAHPSGCKDSNVGPDLPHPSTLTTAENKPSKCDSRRCPYCNGIFETKLELKTHLNTLHPETKHVCPLCGETFTLPQELGSHRRYKVCIASTSQTLRPATQLKDETTSKKSWQCSDCSFSSSFESELIFHRIIHTEGLTALQSLGKLACPLCEKSFTKHSLRHHLRQHTNEKIFSCEICKRSFSRRHNYKDHMQYVHSVGGVKQRTGRGSTNENFICDTCGKIFRTKYSLKVHINIHLDRDRKFLCPVENCLYVGRNQTALSMHKNTHLEKNDFICKEEGCRYQGKSAYHLKRHMKNHLEPEKVYKCPECDFKAKIPGHIRRHIRVHTGECPYKCPHCDYQCAYIENLRKHILTTKKHPGKFIYHCNQCDPETQFKTNYINEYQLHLTTTHTLQMANTS